MVGIYITQKHRRHASKPGDYVSPPWRALAVRLSQSGQDVGVTSVQNGQNTNSEQLTDSSTQFVVTTLEVVDLGLGQHGVVFQFRLSQDWGVGSDDDQLSLTLSQSLNGRLVTQRVLTGLDNKCQLLTDVFLVLSWGLNKYDFNKLTNISHRVGAFSLNGTL